MKYQLHPACSAWPEMPPEALHELADDISANGLHEPLTLTPGGLLLDGRNRALACEIAGVEPKTVVYEGDPALFSLSKNARRRHMNRDQIVMVAAKLATRTVGNPRFAIGSNEPIRPARQRPSNAEVAAAAGVPETSIKSAKTVVNDGAPEEIEAVKSGKAKLRATADTIRARNKPAPAAPFFFVAAEPAAAPALRARKRGPPVVSGLAAALITSFSACDDPALARALQREKAALPPDEVVWLIDGTYGDYIGLSRAYWKLFDTNRKFFAENAQLRKLLGDVTKERDKLEGRLAKKEKGPPALVAGKGR
jgi:hypothetical protein